MSTVVERGRDYEIERIALDQYRWTGQAGLCYPDEHGEWHRSNCTITEPILPEGSGAGLDTLSEPEEFTLTCDTIEFPVAFSLFASGGQKIRTRDNECFVVMRAQDVYDVQGTVADNKVLYEGAWENSDLEYSAVPAGLNKHIILHKRPEHNIWTFEIEYSGLDMIEGDNEITWNRDGEELWRTRKPWAWDAECNTTSGAFEVIYENGRTFYVISMNSDWLDNAIYPVTIDPTITITNTHDGTYPTYGDGSRLLVGCNRKVAIAFPYSSLPDGVVSSATLQLKASNTVSYSGSDKAPLKYCSGFRCTANWPGTASLETAVNSYDASSESNRITTMPSFLDFNLTSATQYAIDNKTYARFIVKTEPVPSAKGWVCHSKDGSYPPKLTIIYTPIVAPTVTTGSASSISSTGATLNGTLSSDGGEACTCSFQWGKTTSYGNTTSTLSRTTGQTFARSISGLSPKTTYHYRAKAVNSKGTVYGTDKTFTTPAALPTVTTGAVSNVATATATLNGTLTADGGEAANCSFQYGAVPNFDGVGAPTFTRASSATNPETGASVSSNTPRYVSGKFGKAVLVEEGTTNLVVSPDDGTLAGNIPGCSGKYHSFDDGYAVKDWVVSSTPATGKAFTYSIWMRSTTSPASTAIMYVYDGAGSDGGWWSFAWDVQLTPEWKRYSFSRNDMTGTVTKIRIYRKNKQGTIDIACPQLETKPYATSFIDGTRATETLTIPTEGVLNPQEGTVECWWTPTQPSESIINQTYSPRILQAGTYYANNSWVLWAYHTGGGEPKLKLYIKGSSNSGWSAYPTIKDSGSGWYTVGQPIHLAVRWTGGDTFYVAVNGEVYGPYTIADAFTGIAGNTFWVGGSNSYPNAIYDCLRISYRARTDKEIMASYASYIPSVTDDFTSYNMSFDGSLSYNTAMYDTTSAVSRTSGQTFSQNISYLNPLTTYYYRTKATNSAGTRYGSITSFQTLDFTKGSADIPGLATLGTTGIRMGVSSSLCEGFSVVFANGLRDRYAIALLSGAGAIEASVFWMGCGKSTIPGQAQILADSLAIRTSPAIMLCNCDFAVVTGIRQRIGAMNALCVGDAVVAANVIPIGTAIFTGCGCADTAGIVTALGAAESIGNSLLISDSQTLLVGDSLMLFDGNVGSACIITATGELVIIPLSSLKAKPFGWVDGAKPDIDPWLQHDTPKGIWRIIPPISDSWR